MIREHNNQAQKQDMTGKDWVVKNCGRNFTKLYIRKSESVPENET